MPARRGSPLRSPAALPVALALLAAACAGDDQAASDAGSTGAATTDGSTSASDGSTSDGMTEETGTTAGETTGEVGPPPLPPLDAAPLTLDGRRVPVKLQAAEPLEDPRVPANLELLLDLGYGDVMDAPGEPIVDRTLGDGPAPTPGAGAALLTRFVHLADTQLADDESPTRVALLDSPDALNSAFRPQEAHMCQVLNAAARTINAIAGERPLDFVLLGGDNIDSVQGNELDWFVRILDGGPGPVHCDSGADDDPLAGPDNDPKDPFTPVGLDVPWRWVNGNHDVLVQGNFTVSSQANLAIGDKADGGTRDWSMPGGPIVTGTIVADPARALQTVPELLERVASAGDGHGIDAATVDRGRALYDFAIGDSGVRVVVVDTAAATGADLGVIHAADVDAYLRPTLDAAEAAGEAVIIASHHCSTSLSDGGGLGGTVQEDALTTADWQAFLGEYDGVILHLCAHSHRHRVDAIEPLGGSPYWEMRTASLVDHPQQMRVVELRDEDNGYLSVTGIAFDFYDADDPLAAAGRARAVLDYTSDWRGTGEGASEDRNVRLWMPLP
ncbi:MAG: metallophosphoesterase [Nannocystaceae bacterium]